MRAANREHGYRPCGAQRGSSTAVKTAWFPPKGISMRISSSTNVRVICDRGDRPSCTDLELDTFIDRLMATRATRALGTVRSACAGGHCGRYAYWSAETTVSVRKEGDADSAQYAMLSDARIIARTGAEHKKRVADMAVAATRSS